MSATKRQSDAATSSFRGFSMPELLVVIGIIVLIAIIAVPSFKALSGNRSTEAAHNQLAGLLGRARAEAIGLQKIHGVAFFTDPESQRVVAYMVQQAESPTVAPTLPMGYAVDVYLDFKPEREPVLMPRGVGLQMIDDAIVADPNPTMPTPSPYDDVRSDDAYIGFNTEPDVNGVPVTYGGVILFDAYGRVVSKRYAFKCYTEVPSGSMVGPPTIKKLSNLGKAWGMPDPPAPGAVDLYPKGNPRSQFGFVAFDEEIYGNLISGDGKLADLYADPAFIATPVAYGAANPATGITEAAEEKWLDDNSTPELVNRSNGTLVRGD